MLEPLHKLLRKENEWNWSQECQESFKCCKQLLCSDAVLELYTRRSKPLKLSCDASVHGVAALISHVVNGEERTVAYASRS